MTASGLRCSLQTLYNHSYQLVVSYLWSQGGCRSWIYYSALIRTGIKHHVYFHVCHVPQCEWWYWKSYILGTYNSNRITRLPFNSQFIYIYAHMYTSLAVPCCTRAFPVVAFFTFLWVQLDVVINQENEWMAGIGYGFAICAELFEIIWPAVVRMVSNQNCTILSWSAIHDACTSIAKHVLCSYSQHDFFLSVEKGLC